MQKAYYSNTNQKKADMDVLSNKVDFRIRNIVKDRQGHYIMIKWWVHWDDMTIFNMYAPNNRALKYLKYKTMELKGEVVKSTIIVKKSVFYSYLTKE